MHGVAARARPGRSCAETYLARSAELKHQRDAFEAGERPGHPASVHVHQLIYNEWAAGWLVVPSLEPG